LFIALVISISANIGLLLAVTSGPFSESTGQKLLTW
jgi:hypothetical protein